MTFSRLGLRTGRLMAQRQVCTPKSDQSTTHPPPIHTPRAHQQPTPYTLPGPISQYVCWVPLKSPKHHPSTLSLAYSPLHHVHTTPSPTILDPQTHGQLYVLTVTDAYHWWSTFPPPQKKNAYMFIIANDN